MKRAIVALSCALAATFAFAAEEVLTIPSRSGVTLSYLLVRVSVSGGDVAQTGPCAPLSAHGFFGREEPVVQAMKDWMLGREFARDIR